MDLRVTSFGVGDKPALSDALPTHLCHTHFITITSICETQRHLHVLQSNSLGPSRGILCPRPPRKLALPRAPLPGSHSPSPSGQLLPGPLKVLLTRGGQGARDSRRWAGQGPHW